MLALTIPFIKKLKHIRPSLLGLFITYGIINIMWTLAGFRKWKDSCFSEGTHIKFVRKASELTQKHFVPTNAGCAHNWGDIVSFAFTRTLKIVARLLPTNNLKEPTSPKAEKSGAQSVKSVRCYSKHSGAQRTVLGATGYRAPFRQQPWVDRSRIAFGVIHPICP